MERLIGLNLGGSFNYIDGKTKGQLATIEPTEVTMTLESAGLYYLDGETTQASTPTPDNPVCLVNTYTEGLYETTIGETTYKFALDESLRSAGNTKDKLYINITEGTAYVVRNIIKVKLNGEEPWIKPESLINRYSIVLNNCRAEWGVQTSLCSILPHNISRAWNGTNGYGIDANGKLILGLTNIDSIDKLKNYAKENNIILYHQLKTPITESINLE